jgi:hypothetical protein
MDYLRAGYTAPARWQASGDSTITLRWFRAAEGAAVYPLPHAFGSTVWDIAEDVAQAGPGELPNSRIAWAGSPSNPPPGLSTDTPAEWLSEGVPVGAVAPFACVTHVSGIANLCTCCSGAARLV